LSNVYSIVSSTNKTVKTEGEVDQTVTTFFLVVIKYTLVSSTNKAVRQKVNLIKQLLVVKNYTLVSSTNKTITQKVNLIKQLLVVYTSDN
jgi:hypothetical protein